MKFRIPLFFLFISMVSGLVLLAAGFLWPAYFIMYAQPAIEKMGATHQEQEVLLAGWTKGFRILGLLVVAIGIGLFLFRKKLSNAKYAGIFVLLILISLVTASAVAIYS